MFVGDIVQVAGDTVGMHGIVSRRLASTIRDAYETGQNNGCECIKINLVAHSQGGAISVNAMSLLSKEIREKICYVGLGAQIAMPNSSGLGGIRNIRNEHDVVPKLPNELYDLPFIADPNGEIFNPLDYGFPDGQEDGWVSGHTLSNESYEKYVDGSYYNYLRDNPSRP